MTLDIWKVSIIPDLEPKSPYFMLTSILLLTLLLNIEIVSPNWAPEINPVICYTQTPLSRVCIHFRQLGKVLLKRELFLISSCLSSQTHYWAHFNPKYHHPPPTPPNQVTPVSILITYSVSPWVHSVCTTLIFWFVHYLSPGHSYSRPLIGCSGGPLCHLCASPLLSRRPSVRINSTKS